MTTNDNIRDIKRPYRKKAFQTGYSVKGDGVQSPTLPYHTYSTETHKQTQSQRPAIDPATYKRPVRPTIEYSEGYNLNPAVYPWNLVPKGDSANVIQRQVTSFAATTVADNEYFDILVVNVAPISGSNASTTPQSIPSIPPTQPQQTTSTTGASSASANPFPTTGGSTITPIAGTRNTGGFGEFYRIIGFGHSEATSTAGLTYEIWVDGSLMMQWSDFQWSPVSPQVDQWRFEQPITVESQIVFRIVNETGGDLTTGSCEGVFAGWTEQRMGYFDTDHPELQGV